MTHGRPGCIGKERQVVALAQTRLGGAPRVSEMPRDALDRVYQLEDRGAGL